MKITNIILALLTLTMLLACGQKQPKENEKHDKSHSESTMTGIWLRMSPQGPVKMEFKKTGKVTIDFGNDQAVEVSSNYIINGDTVEFTDVEGKMCPAPGTYLMDETPYYLAFDVLNDTCNGRIKTTSGFWTKPNFRELQDTLDKQIAANPEAKLQLMRGRLYMATGNSAKARKDFSAFIAKDSSNARVFINRAATFFPGDMQSVLADCERAIALDPENKNAWFMRGLALYEMDRKKEACESFSKAIELGFSVLRIAEKQKCAEYWDIENTP
ncbi:tetratricopeptide repeat protein [Salinivirga cyanobacteriivorans]